MRTIVTFLSFLLLTGLLPAQQRPSMLVNAADIAAIKRSAGRYPLFERAVAEAKAKVDAAIAAPMDVPVPKDAGGYTHERHKQNYGEMQMAGILYQVTKDERYVRFIREMLLKYAALYPTLGTHPAAASEAPGRLFWQSLNESVWMVNTMQAYDCVYDRLTAQERRTIEEGVFRPMVRYFSVDQKHILNRIHNHGTWMSAAVGMAGFAMRDTSMVAMALYGTNRDKKGGFLNQLELLFSPDGYFTEGPYYIRYAIMPFMVFAQAIDHNRPDLKIFEYRDGILKKAFYTMLQLTYTTGQFLPINDALKEKTYRSPEVIQALNIAYKKFRNDPALLAVAKDQGSVTLTGGGIEVAAALASAKEPAPFPYKSFEVRDGADGSEGGVGILRYGPNSDQMLALMKYTGHGLSHGHYDKLSLLFYDQQREQLQDYGAARFINVEPKYGGRYLPETKSFAMQTIAHNTVTVDERSHYDGKIDISEQFHADRNFFSVSDPDLQMMSATCTTAYPGVAMRRTVLMVNDPSLAKPVLVDIFTVDGPKQHTFDLPFYYMGQFIHTNIKLQSYTAQQSMFGPANGYQHLWKEAEGKANGLVQFSWLSGQRYYSVSSAADSQTTVYSVRIGANDPNINLRREPAMILRKTGRSAVFASVIEPHGVWDGTIEISRNASSAIRDITVLASDSIGTAVRIDRKDGTRWTVLVSNGPASDTDRHTMNVNGTVQEWTGNAVIRKH
ncbi:MAG: alginate lyase family protein [Bacteroidetes bacterium]|nr:alginate lyase family protein [Bacteroidota bacterium]